MSTPRLAIATLVVLVGWVLGRAAASTQPAVAAATGIPDKPLWTIGGYSDPPGVLSSPQDALALPGGGFVVVEQGNHRFQRMAADGSVRALWGSTGSAPGQLDGPGAGRFALALAADSSFWVTDPGNSRVQHFTPDGSWLSAFPVAKAESAYRSSLAGLATAADGTLYVTDAASQRVLHYRPDGTLLAAWGTQGAGPDQLNSPQGLTWTAAGELLVADQGNKRLQRFGASGEPLGSWTLPGAMPEQPGTPMDVEAAADGTLWVTEMLGGRLHHLAADGSSLGVWAVAGSDPSAAPDGLSLAPDGTVWLADRLNHRVKSFRSDGSPAATWGQAKAYELYQPGGVAAAPDGSYFATDLTSQNVWHLGAHGERLGSFGGPGTGPGQFDFQDTSAGIVVAADGSLWVADDGNRRLQRLDAAGTWLGEIKLTPIDPGDNLRINLVALAPDGSLFAAGNGGVFHFRADGAPLSQWKTYAGRFRLGTVRGLAVAPDGLVYLTDDGYPGFTQRVHRFRPDGTWLGAAPESLDGFCPRQIGPRGALGITPDAQLFALENYLVALDPTGRVLADWSPQAAGVARFDLAASFAATRAGLVVADRGSHSLRAFGWDYPQTWRASYFGNPWLAGWPAAVADLAEPDQTWGPGPPAPGLPADGWSLRLERQLAFEAGQHNFQLHTRGGARLWLDGRPLVDRWAAAAVDEGVSIRLGAGGHQVRLELRAPDGGAVLAWSSRRADEVAPTMTVTQTPVPLATQSSATPTPVLTAWATPFPERLFLPRLAHEGGPAVAATAPAPFLPVPGLDVERYDLDLTVADLGAGDPTAVVTVTLRLAAPADHVDLDVEPFALKVDAVSEAGRALPFALVAGKSNNHGLSGSRLRAWPGRVIPADQAFALTVRYHLDRATFGGNRGMMYSADYQGSRVLVVRGLPYYARYWLPSNDHPTDVATARLTLHVPDGVLGAANGRLLSGDYKLGSGLDAAGRRVFRWSMDQPVPPYLLTVAIGDYGVYSEDICYDVAGHTATPSVCTTAQHRLPFVYYFPKRYTYTPNPKDAYHGWIDAVVAFSGRLAPYPFDKLGFVSAPHPYSAEYASLVVLGTRGLSDGLHETFHSWWGDSMRVASWGDFWIKESLAEYLSGYWREESAGLPSGLLAPCSTVAINRPPDFDPVGTFIMDDQATLGSLTTAPYSKGAAAWHDLRQRMAAALGVNLYDEQGRAAFLSLLGSLYRAHAGRAISTPELVAYLRDNVGPRLAEAGAQLPPDAGATMVDAWARRWLDMSLYP
jgi:sugar lactone lactonase YvrE